MTRSIRTRIRLVAMPIALAAVLAMSPAQAAAMTPNQMGASGVLDAINADINYFWWWTFRSAGWAYQAPAGYVWYDGPGLQTNRLDGWLRHDPAQQLLLLHLELEHLPRLQLASVAHSRNR